MPPTCPYERPEPFYVPQKYAGERLQGEQEEHYSKIARLLEGIELRACLRLEGAWLTQEEAVKIIGRLGAQPFPEVLRCWKILLFEFFLDQVVDKPENIVADEDEPDEVMQLDGLPQGSEEREDIGKSQVNAGEYKHHDSNGVYRMPDPDRQGVQDFSFVIHV